MLNANGVEKNEFLEYKGRPLVRSEDDIYYGDLSEKYYIYMMILTTDTVSGQEDVPSQIMIQLINSETKSPEKQHMVVGLAEALDYANIWLERYNK